MEMMMMMMPSGGSESSNGTLAPSADTIRPLPKVLHFGLRGVVALASLSLLTTTLLFAHLTYKLIRYSTVRIRSRIARKKLASQHQHHNKTQAGWPGSSHHYRHDSVDLTLGLDELHFGAKGHLKKPARSTTSSLAGDDYSEAASSGGSSTNSAPPPPNQFVVLLYNLLLADMHQAMAFFLNAAWVAGDGIFVDTAACWTQGLFISNGDLASSCFIATIALHTYLTIVRGYRPPEWALNAWIVAAWVFVYGITLAGIVSTGNGRSAGGYYVRAAAWCWINDAYDNLRLTTHYMYIFIALVATPVVYGAIFLHLRTRLARVQMREHGGGENAAPTRPPLRHTASVLDIMTASSSSSSASSSSSQQQISYDHHPAFLIYPLIYVVCTLPLALGRVGSLAGAPIPLWYFCMAGALIASNGWLDCLLWGTTRHTIVFGPLEASADALGLETFHFMRTPPDREFGNMVWVQGQASEEDEHGGDAKRKDGSTGGGRLQWWGWGSGSDDKNNKMSVASGRVLPAALLRPFRRPAEVVGEREAVERRLDSSGSGSRGSGILGRPDVDGTYRCGHVKGSHATDVDMLFDPSPPPTSSSSSSSSINIKKQMAFTVVTVDKDDLESGYSTPGAGGGR